MKSRVQISTGQTFDRERVKLSWDKSKKEDLSNTDVRSDNKNRG